MNKAAYLASSEVASFIQWWASQLGENSTLGHHYVKPGAAQIEFANLADALNKYDWPFQVSIGGEKLSGRSFEDNCVVLGRLKRALVEARTSDETCQAAIGVVVWGGVSNGNKNWLQRNEPELAGMLARTAVALRSGDDDVSKFEDGLRFNAGMTKVYSLLVDGLIIYDSRVAAALAWFVLTWMRQAKRSAIPDTLNFPCMPAKEGLNPEIRKLRNPGMGARAFQKMQNRARLHAQWNLRASWIIEAVLAAASATPFHRQDEPARAVEAALFMWGYDLSKNSPWLKEERPDEADDDESESVQSTPVAPTTGAGYRLATRGHALPFWWHFDEAQDRICIRRAKNIGDNFELDATFSLLHQLYYRFGEEMIPLANNLIKLQNGTAADGLARAIMDMPGSTVQLGQAASYLGPVMEAVGVFEWNQQRRNIAFRFRDSPPATIQLLRDALSEFAR